MQVTPRKMYGSEDFLTWTMACADSDLDIRIGWPNNALCLNMEVVTYVLFAAYHKYSLHNISSDSVAK